jgi:hypothetical protein
VETLITIQAENLGTVIEPTPDTGGEGTRRFEEFLEGAPTLFVCDSNPATVELVRGMVEGAGTNATFRVAAEAPKLVELAAPELKGKVLQVSRAQAQEEERQGLPPLLAEKGRKVFLATARPDPLFGIVDARVQACLDWVPGAHREAALARKDFEPTPFVRTASYDEVEELANGFREARFLTVIPKGGKVRSVLESASFDAVKNGFLDATMPPARGVIVGAGGRGYDDTFSSALRSVWGALVGVKKSGEVLLVSECPRGLGSAALGMLASGRISAEGKSRSERYVDGLEEVYYLGKLKEEYGVLLLSGLPELFAKNKLGLATARGSGEAVGRLLNKLGRTTKVNVFTRAAECRAVST